MGVAWGGMMLADPSFLVAEFIEPAQHLQVEVVPLFQPALRRMRGHREISDFHEVSSRFLLTRFLRANRYPLRSKTLCSFRSASLRASESIARQGCGGGMTKHPGQARVARRWLLLSPCGRGWLASPDARRVRGLPPRMQTPHPARTAHSRCKSIGVLLKNGGRRPPMATFSHKGRREEARLSPRPELGLAEQRLLRRGLRGPILRRGLHPGTEVGGGGPAPARVVHACAGARDHAGPAGEEPVFVP